MKSWIQNHSDLATTKEREDALHVLNSAYSAIDTSHILEKSIKIENDTLTIKDQTFNLKNYENIKVIGFGKASCKAAEVIERILGKTLTSGQVIGITGSTCEIIQTHSGTHPLPSTQNVDHTEKILDYARQSTEKDLYIVIVSGGGSALLCYPLTECDQGTRLYQDFLGTGGNISDLNLVRKHLSKLKGGGLAKELYPATVISLIFSDVPGNNWDSIASGPTYKDNSTVEDAKAILEKYNLTGYELNETPKEDKYFEKVTNIPLVTNKTALIAMQESASSLGYKTNILSDSLYDPSEEVVKQMKAKLGELEAPAAVIAGGEPKQLISKDHNAIGGRNLYTTLVSLEYIDDNEIFISFASDGLDNSKAAGAIADKTTKDMTSKEEIDRYKKSRQTKEFFDNKNQTIYTGPTEANVSDLFIILKK